MINIKFVKGVELTTKELYEGLKISQATWKRRREDILKDMKLSGLDFEIFNKGRAIVYYFLSDGEYVYDAYNSKQRKEIYENAILPQINEHPENTATNVARIIANNIDIKETLHHAETTVIKNTRAYMKLWYGNKVGDIPGVWEDECYAERKGYIIEKVWCFLDKQNNIYYRLPDDEIEGFYDIVSKRLKATKEFIEQLDELDSEDCVDKGEKEKMIGRVVSNNYIDAKHDFAKKYGHYPIKVPVYVNLDHTIN